MMSRSFALMRTYSNNGGPVTDVGKRVIDVGQLDLSGLEGAAAGLEVWVLVADAELLGEVLRQADFILARKRKIKFIISENVIYCDKSIIL